MISETTPRRRLIKMIRCLIPILLIAASIAVASYLYTNRPVARRGRPQIPPPLVETMRVTPGTHVVTPSAMGTVIPSRTITLKSRVGGFVQKTSRELIPGGFFKKGDVMLRLEQEDFLLNVAKQKAVLARLRAELRLEMGKQAVAQEEFKLLQNSSKRAMSNADLALREPQLAQIKADIAKAKTDLDQATLDLGRAIIKAPFNCMVMTVNVEIGSQVSSQDPLASLSGTDDYWVKATLPTDQLKWITFPRNSHDLGSKATITTRDGTIRKGRVIRLLGELGQETRLATLLIRIKHPLDLQDRTVTPLLLNSYVQIRIQGTRIPHVIALPRNLVRDGDQVWCLYNGQLVIKPIDIQWRDENQVFVSGGLDVNDEIIISDLASPVAGMALRTQAETSPPLPEKNNGTPPMTTGKAVKNNGGKK